MACVLQKNRKPGLHLPEFASRSLSPGWNLPIFSAAPTTRLAPARPGRPDCWGSPPWCPGGQSGQMPPHIARPLSARRHGRRLVVPVRAPRWQSLRHWPASFCNVAQFGGQIQQADLVANDILVETAHGVAPWCFCAVLMKIRPSIKTAALWQGPTVRSSLHFYT